MESEGQRSRWQEPSTSRTCSKMYTFCENTTACTRTRDPFDSVGWLVFRCFRKVVIAAGDSRFIDLACRDLVAAEECHHDRCFWDCTIPDKASKYTDLENSEPDSDENQFFWYRVSSLWQNVWVYLIGFIKSQANLDGWSEREAVISMRSMGATEISESTKKTFPKKVRKRFRRLITIWRSPVQ